MASKICYYFYVREEILMIEVKNVKENSTADKLGIEAGDKIISINGKKIKDYIEYNYQVADFQFDLKIEKKNGKIIDHNVERSYDEELGIEFDEIVFDGLNICKNKCIFCFVDQQPPDLRHTLNLKDDDYRFSFLQGSYITLTNIDDNELKRIVKYNLSPINISVHTTDPDLREYMMKNPKARQIKEQLDYLYKNGIKFNTQIVLCPDINDKEKLNESIQDLTKYYPNILSLAIVPVGLTKYKNENLRTYSNKEAKEVVKQVKIWQNKIEEKFGENFLYLSDEFYLMSDYQIPKYDHYNDFPQLENGVGLTRLFRHGYDDIKNEYIDKIQNNKKRSKYYLLTSILGGKAIEPVINDINNSQDKARLIIKTIKNKFFGETVTVTGLLTAQDIKRKIKQLDIKNIIIPGIILNEENKFLDEVTIKDFKNNFDDKNIYVCNDIKDILEVLGDGKTSSGNSR